MAKVPIAEVKQDWRDVLAALPEFSGGTVPIHAAWPGADLLFLTNLPAVQNWKAAIWFGPSTPLYERHSMRADRQRRIVTVNFQVCVEVQMSGESNDQTKTDMIALLAAEQIAFDLWQPIDEHVADEKHLGRPDLVESAIVDGDQAVAGFTESGVGYRLEMPVSAKFRLL